MERTIAERGLAAENILQEAPLRSDQWLAQSVAEWRSETLRQVESEGADRLREAIAAIDVAPSAGPREHSAYLQSQIALLARA